MKKLTKGQINKLEIMHHIYIEEKTDHYIYHIDPFAKSGWRVVTSRMIKSIKPSR